MVDAVEISNNRILVTKNDLTAFDTSHPSLIRLPDSTHIVRTDFTVTFPSYLQKKAYARWAGAGGTTACELWSTLFRQEWGPDETYYNEQNGGSTPAPGISRRNLPRELLGSVPPETTYLDIRVKLQRTTTPPAYFGLEAPPILFAENEWITLAGLSCPCEVVRDYAVRTFDIARIGDQIYLERFQSVRDADTTANPAGGAQASLSSGDFGWNSNAQWSELSNALASDGSTLRPRSNFYIYNLLNKRGPDANGTKIPGDGPNSSNTCRGAWSDLTSVYTGEIQVVPCIFKTS